MDDAAEIAAGACYRWMNRRLTKVIFTDPETGE